MELEADDIIKVIKAYEFYQANLKEMKTISFTVKSSDVEFYCQKGVEIRDHLHKLLAECLGEETYRGMSGNERAMLLIDVSSPFYERMGKKDYSDLTIHFIKLSNYGPWYAGGDLDYLTNRAKDYVLRMSVN